MFLSVTGCEVAVDSTLASVGEEAAAVDDGAGGNVGAATWPVHPTRANIIMRSATDLAQFEQETSWLFIVILLYLT